MTTSQSATLARFERVDEHGDLIFEAHGQNFRVVIDDRLEQGILASKQIREENNEPARGITRSSIPISTIQSMVRAGDDIANIAEHFAISEALVRRFAKPVETEKKYALDQFLVAPAPGSLRHRTVRDVLAASLDTVNIPMSAVQWKTTRQGHNPWQIEASFTLSGQTIRAQWSWNLHDNTVTPLNTTGGRLLRIARADLDHFELEAAQMTDLFENTASQQTQQQTSLSTTAQSSSYAQTSQSAFDSQQLNTPVADAPLGVPADHESNKNSVQPVSSRSADSWVYGTGTTNIATQHTTQSSADEQQLSTSVSTPTTEYVNPFQLRNNVAQSQHASTEQTEQSDEAHHQPSIANISSVTARQAQNSTAAAGERSISQEQTAPSKQTSGMSNITEQSSSNSDASSSTHNSESKSRKPRRSAVPSWDEILFGE